MLSCLPIESKCLSVYYINKSLSSGNHTQYFPKLAMNHKTTEKSYRPFNWNFGWLLLPFQNVFIPEVLVLCVCVCNSSFHRMCMIGSGSESNDSINHRKYDDNEL